jgi:hypothetical protein
LRKPLTVAIEIELQKRQAGELRVELSALGRVVEPAARFAPRRADVHHEPASIGPRAIRSVTNDWRDLPRPGRRLELDPR